MTSNRYPLEKQSGLATVEFAIIGAIFFMILFGIIEFGRLLYTWNMLDEVTRRAARLAAVCPMDQTNRVQQVAVFDETLLNGLTPANVDVRYLDQGFSETGNVSNVRYVQTRITGYQHQLLIPFVPAGSDILTAPPFTTTLPSESLGLTAAGSWSVQC